ncbi:hypothetical protein DSO57_1013680 [Entomophthora muscae]|uniref:Uncharacterized protein n=1 Tax=Entomophthora muscae TaxID=34485 RepID=A0ACC2SUE9_9FUNG|nr:hypothetical protein DSO57_1013680 [Entomophthora muscae]
MKTQVALISLLVAKAQAQLLDSTGIASYCVTHQAFEEQARIWRDSKNPAFISAGTQGWVDCSLKVPYAPDTRPTYTEEEYDEIIGEPGVVEMSIVDQYIRENENFHLRMLLSKVRLIWSGPQVLQEVECPEDTLCRLSIKWEDGAWSSLRPVLPATAEKDTIHIKWSQDKTQIEYLFVGPSTRSLVANTAYRKFEISFTDTVGLICPKDQVYEYHNTTSLNTKSRHFGSITGYIYPE